MLGRLLRYRIVGWITDVGENVPRCYKTRRQDPQGRMWGKVAFRPRSKRIFISVAASTTATVTVATTMLLRTKHNAYVVDVCDVCGVVYQETICCKRVVKYRLYRSSIDHFLEFRTPYFSRTPSEPEVLEHRWRCRLAGLVGSWRSWIRFLSSHFSRPGKYRSRYGNNAEEGRQWSSRFSSSRGDFVINGNYKH